MDVIDVRFAYTLVLLRTAMGDKRAIKGHNNYIIKTKSTIALVIDNTQKRMLANKRVAIEGPVASWDGNSHISILGDLRGCKANARHCVMADGVLMWDETPFEKICPFELKNSYKIKISGSHMVIDDMQAAFFIMNNLFGHPNCPELKKALYTEQSIVVQFDPSNFTQNEPSKQISALYTYDSLDVDPINSKLIFLEEKIRNFELQSFKNVWNEPCCQAQCHLDLVWQLLHLDTTIGARAFLQRTDIIAEFTREAITLWPCHGINASETYKNHKINGTCYKNLLVVVNKKLMFLTQRGTNLTEESQKVDCNYMHMPLFKFNGTWFSKIGKTHGVAKPLVTPFQGLDKPWNMSLWVPNK
uniref:Uncharacterized protein n=1 Tax=Romanomermis culicivorax TaxID=13658 RepID=A0A915J6I7_ROMCU